MEHNLIFIRDLIVFKESNKFLIKVNSLNKTKPIILQEPEYNWNINKPLATLFNDTWLLLDHYEILYIELHKLNPVIFLLSI